MSSTDNQTTEPESIANDVRWAEKAEAEALAEYEEARQLTAVLKQIARERGIHV